MVLMFLRSIAATFDSFSSKIRILISDLTVRHGAGPVSLSRRSTGNSSPPMGRGGDDITLIRIVESMDVLT